jgi:hypothetical protein
LDGAFGFIDGLKLLVQSAVDLELENAMYNAWTHNHSISNVIVFAPDGVCVYQIHKVLIIKYYNRYYYFL